MDAEDPVRRCGQSVAAHHETVLIFASITPSAMRARLSRCCIETHHMCITSSDTSWLRMEISAARPCRWRCPSQNFSRVVSKSSCHSTDVTTLLLNISIIPLRSRFRGYSGRRKGGTTLQFPMVPCSSRDQWQCCK